MARAAGAGKKARANGDSLTTVYREIEKLLRRCAPPLKASRPGVRGKNSLQLTVPEPVAVPGAYEESRPI
jgi:hypothetical protein